MTKPLAKSSQEWLATLNPGDRVVVHYDGDPYEVLSKTDRTLTLRNTRKGHRFVLTGTLIGHARRNTLRPPYVPPAPPPPPAFTIPVATSPESRRPRAAGVYRAFDVHSVLLYVGFSINPPERLKYHAQRAPWWALVSRTTVEWFDSTTEAARAERDAILTELPLYNSRGAALPYISPV